MSVPTAIGSERDLSDFIGLASLQEDINSNNDIEDIICQ